MNMNEMRARIFTMDMPAVHDRCWPDALEYVMTSDDQALFTASIYYLTIEIVGKSKTLTIATI